MESGLLGLGILLLFQILNVRKLLRCVQDVRLEVGDCAFLFVDRPEVSSSVFKLDCLVFEGCNCFKTSDFEFAQVWQLVV